MMERTQIYIFTGERYNEQANKFLQDAPRVDGNFVLERLDVTPEIIVIIAKVGWLMVDDMWRKYLEIRAKE